MNLEQLAILMQTNVNRVDGEFPLVVDYYDGSQEDEVDEGIDVYYRDSDGLDNRLWIDTIVKIDADGVIHCKDSQGQAVKVEIYSRVTQFDLMVKRG